MFTEEYDVSIIDSIVVSIPACLAGDRGSIPRRGESIFLSTDILFLNRSQSKRSITIYISI